MKLSPRQTQVHHVSSCFLRVNPGLASLVGELDCWTLVDFDGDGDLDLVKTRPVDRTDRLSARKVLYYEQAGQWESGANLRFRGRSLKLFFVVLNLYPWSNVTGLVSPMWSLQESNSSSNRSGGKFHRRDGKDNPFRSVDLAALPDTKGLGPFCPHVADIDQDGDLDLILVYDTKALFLYYRQQNGSFQLAAEDPFADISITREAGFRWFSCFQNVSDELFLLFLNSKTLGDGQRLSDSATARIPPENMGG